MRLDTAEPFSAAFLSQCIEICASLGIATTVAPVNLDLLAQALASLHRDVGVLDSQLELVYRWRGSSQTSPIKGPWTKKARHSSVSSSEEEKEVQKAIALSLLPQQASESPPTRTDAGKEASSLPATPQASSSSKRRRKDSQMPPSQPKTPQTAEIARKAAEIRESEEGDIIGTTKFSYQEDKLEAYLDQALTFWNGRVRTYIGQEETS